MITRWSIAFPLSVSVWLSVPIAQDNKSTLTLLFLTQTQQCDMYYRMPHLHNFLTGCLHQSPFIHWLRNTVKGICSCPIKEFTQNWKWYNHCLAHKFFISCMNNLLLMNTQKKDFLKNVSSQTVDLVLTSIVFVGSHWGQWNSVIFKISSFVFGRRIKIHTGLEQLDGEKMVI